MSSQRRRPLTFKSLLGLWLWQILSTIIVGIAYPLSQRVRKEWQQRQLRLADLNHLAQARTAKPRAALFFCASAGEYEQAAPLIERLRHQGDWFVHVIFVSQSGKRYVCARNEDLSWQLAPFDSTTNWLTLFEVLRPDVCFVIRHEFWPCFLAQAWSRSWLVLVDASLSKDHWWHRVFMTQILRWFDRVFVVDEADLPFFAASAKNACVSVSGDTKFDRAFERSAAQQPAIAALRTEIDQRFGSKRRFIVGSAWPEDVAVALKAYQLLSAATRQAWQLILVPHDISATMTNRIIAMVQEANLEVIAASADQADRSYLTDQPAHNSTPVYLVDQMGRLAEWYGCANLAMVGGAMHHQIHNVIEPVSHNLPIAFGPRYQMQREACLFVKLGLATVVTDAEELRQWWEGFGQATQQNANDQLKLLCGASDKIIADTLRHRY